jgi:hypothetical protein
MEKRLVPTWRFSFHGNTTLSGMGRAAQGLDELERRDP